MTSCCKSGNISSKNDESSSDGVIINNKTPTVMAIVFCDYRSFGKKNGFLHPVSVSDVPRNNSGEAAMGLQVIRPERRWPHY
ncbi:hypothetical protein CEXT_364981 [Caerostris extrusa]|uniref:Uncharacterized protein n=1 Tax=Caerostris extrusa TaxID=172846 RepID=A0AAV4TF04_CAEEX|nr:hypothetical protein CEXT_364981 [Caerostris extrusa]